MNFLIARILLAHSSVCNAIHYGTLILNVRSFFFGARVNLLIIVFVSRYRVKKMTVNLVHKGISSY